VRFDQLLTFITSEIAQTHIPLMRKLLTEEDKAWTGAKIISTWCLLQNCSRRRRKESRLWEVEASGASRGKASEIDRGNGNLDNPRKRQTANGKRQTANGKRQTVNGKRDEGSLNGYGRWQF
jgi:hypothetical protein